MINKIKHGIFFILILIFDSILTQTSTEMDRLWQDFKLKNGKLYSNKQEEALRYKVWSDNYNYVLRFNKEEANQKGFFLGLHHFCDLTQNEVAKFKFGLKLSIDDKAKLKLLNLTSFDDEKSNLSSSRKLKSKSKSKLSLSDSVNWVTRGFVSDIKDQGTCGACWSFVSTSALESQLRIKRGELTTLSEQNLIDCSVSYGNDGCDGGLMSQAFSYVKDNKGINPDTIYPYVGAINRCRYHKSNPAAKVAGYVSLPIDEDILMEAVETIGPIAVGIDADHKSFTLYKGGVYFEPACNSENLNHAVLVVGYGTENGQDYWLIKNSWGTNWGEKGFGKIARNRNNHCGIASLAGYPLLV